MLTRVTGQLERVEGNEAVVAMSSGDIAYQVLVPTYLAERLAARVGQRVTLSTLQYLDSPNQGASFIPRLVGFATDGERRFFELLTTVKGIGNRKALRALAVEPSVIAGAIVSKDARALTRLPEIGKRLAETVIVELTGKVNGFLSETDVAGMSAAADGMAIVAAGDPVLADAVEALVALGEDRGDAEALVSKAVARGRREERTFATIEAVLDVVFAARER
ncbi:Holliday junction ATP-dependent DNA helicase RuvA [Phycisphaerales bacterium]|nr:Holliday junction ATP-dependent DNA helicase RuvA [Phycisphaerales bacterium]